MYADIPVPVLQVASGEKGGPGSLPSLLKQGEKEEGGEEKKEGDDDKEEMEGNRRDGQDMQDSLVLEGGMIVQFLLLNFATFAACA